ncbi:MAG: hypothetical protein WBG18_18415 [Xanthobacteraceae bacterium]|jgi:hypothetical protein
MSPLVALSGHPNGVWLSILIPISGIAYYYWMGTEDMAAVYVAAGIMVLAGVGARYVGANNLRIDLNSD